MIGVLAGKDSSFEHHPSKEGHFGPLIRSTYIFPYSFFVPLLAYPEVIGFLYAKGAFFLITPPYNVWALPNPYESLVDFLLKGSPILLTC